MNYDGIWWWHSIELPDGIITDGHSVQHPEWIPEKLNGKTFVDVGAWDGYYSFLAEKRGAVVTSIDDVDWSWGKIRTGKSGFDYAKLKLNSNVSEYVSNLYELSPKTVGVFDIVFCAGVIYHLKNPYEFCEVLRSITNEYAIIVTAILNNDVNEPIFTLWNRGNKDSTNYFYPNIKGLKELFLTVGYKSIDIIQGDNNIKEHQLAVIHAWV